MKGLYELFVKITLVLFEDVLRQEKYVTIHRRNILSLAVELFKVKQYLSNSMLCNIFPAQSRS